MDALYWFLTCDQQFFADPEGLLGPSNKAGRKKSLTFRSGNPH